MYYHFNELRNIITKTEYYKMSQNDKNWIKKRKGENKIIYYLNVPMAFDIETSSFYENNEKRAIMYIWMFAIGEYVFIGRTWDEYETFMYELYNIFRTDTDKRIVVYVHNLAYEFQWIRKHFQWHEVFASDVRKTLYASDISGCEYRCSYMLSGLNLENTANELREHNVRKAVGNLDYSLIRNSKTKLSDEEIEYCINDVLVITAYIDEKIKQDGDITKIPLTKTGYVRNYCRKHCLSNSKGKYNNSYKNLMKNLTIEPDEYIMLKEAFAGGFTHASCKNSNKIFREYDELGSFDFTSSYPTSLISEQYPMGKGFKVKCNSKEDFYKYLKCYCCLFRIKFKNLKENINETKCVNYEHYISESKCLYLSKDAVVENGRVVSASELEITINEVDFSLITFCYKFDDNFEIGDMYCYKKDYLPKEFIECVLEFYKKKTTLKGVYGEDVQYSLFKSMLNAIYGMLVTEILQDEQDYFFNKWNDPIKPNINEAIKEINEKNNRFIYYPFGVWCTSFSRRNLWCGITEFGKDGDYIYSDTDSVKVKNYKKHLDFINKYNDNICKKIEKCLEYRGIDKNAYRPKNIKGIEKPMGVWDFEGEMKYFKTIGAKRYIYKNDEGWHLTVAGTGKKSSMDYIYNTCCGDDEMILDLFSDKLIIPAGHTGKMTHTYIDYETKGIVKDYQGNITEYNELSSIHMEPCEFNMSIQKNYLDFIFNVQTINK